MKIKSTGIVRKVDELGRIVLPIELRRTLDIGEKDAVEIYVEGTSIVLKSTSLPAFSVEIPKKKLWILRARTFARNVCGNYRTSRSSEVGPEKRRGENSRRRFSIFYPFSVGAKIMAICIIHSPWRPLRAAWV